MEDVIVTKDELIGMFEREELTDDNSGWLLNGLFVDIVAIHESDPKYLHDVTNAEYYKIIQKEK